MPVKRAMAYRLTSILIMLDAWNFPCIQLTIFADLHPTWSSTTQAAMLRKAAPVA
jgi:hypothetical protein